MSDTILIMEEENQFNQYHEHMIKILNDIIFCRSTESASHVRYVQEYTRVLAEQYAKLYPRSKMTGHKINLIVQAAGLHDVGKIIMPDSVLKNPGQLSKWEMEQLRDHTIKGGEIIKIVLEFQDRDYRRICYNVCLYHHEKYDGSGYPYGLKKDRIPLEAQLVGLADMYDTLVNAEVNKKPYSKDIAFYMLMNGKCGELAPRMKECLQEAKDVLEQVHIK